MPLSLLAQKTRLCRKYGAFVLTAVLTERTVSMILSTAWTTISESMVWDNTFTIIVAMFIIFSAPSMPCTTNKTSTSMAMIPLIFLIKSLYIFIVKSSFLPYRVWAL